jgi:penicillin-binding protein 1A
MAVLVLVVVGGLGALGVVSWIVSVAASAPPLASLKQKNPGSVSEVLAADGTRLGFIQADELRQPVPDSQLPDSLKQATVAIEDQRFYQHKGVDYEGIVRAAFKNITSHKTVQGGSTLTMQLVRNLYTGNRTRAGLAGYERKIKEAKLAEELEQEHSKAWILSQYLNTVPYGTVGGQTAIGVGAAARIYFNKRVKDLTLRESALLAGLPQAPSDYSPILHPTLARDRRNEVLQKMAQLHMISQARARTLMNRGLGLHMGHYFARRRESFFFDYVKDQLIQQYGAATVKLGGLRVYTTISLRKQQQARGAIQSAMGNIGPSSAIVTIDPRNGNILAMASSSDYGKSKFNLAAQGHRQPGSSFKVFALMTALRMGVNPDTTRYTSRSPTIINDPRYGYINVKTYGGVGAGTLTLHQATLKSDNSVYIQLALDVGPDNVRRTARMMGIRSKLNGYPAETLGGLEQGVSPLEMADAYATIASGGYRNRPRAITKVVFPDGKSSLPERWRVHRVKVFSDGVTYEATKILEDNIHMGTGTHANIGCPAAGKTGTTDHNTDAWFVGFTPHLSTAVWVGYPNARVEMNTLYHGGPVDGGTYPADIWAAYMKQAIGHFCGAFPLPKSPFVSQPFFGHYASTGGRSSSSGGGTITGPVGPATTPTTPTTPASPSTPGNGGTGANGTFDPNKYETPPQPPPKIKGPPSNGNGGAQAPAR